MTDSNNRQPQYPLSDPTVKAAVDTFMQQQTQTAKQSYFYFYSFLQLSNRANWTEKMENDFGDTYLNAFEEFWVEHEEKFLSLKLLKEKGEVDPKVFAELIHIAQENDTAETIASKIDVTPGELIIRLSVVENEMESTMDAVRDILRSTGAYKVGMPSPGQHHWGDYPMLKSPSNLTLEKMLKVYQAKKDTPNKKNFEIGMDLMSLLGCYSCQLSEKDTPHERRGKKDTLGRIVSRYLRQAKAIINGLEQGRFPEYEV